MEKFDVGSRDGLKFAQETETKFQFYAIALIFTILALSVQTSPEYASRISRIFELIAWTFLIIAGFLGLAYIERIPLGIRLMWDYDLVEKELENRRDFQQLAGEDDTYGSDSPHVDTPTEYLERHEYLQSQQLVRMQKFRRYAYQATRWLLLAGVTSLALARGYPLTLEIAGTT
jgi:hypothetical protein